MAIVISIVVLPYINAIAISRLNIYIYISYISLFYDTSSYLFHSDKVYQMLTFVVEINYSSTLNEENCGR